jgi:hypothetical protein
VFVRRQIKYQSGCAIIFRVLEMSSTKKTDTPGCKEMYF